MVLAGRRLAGWLTGGWPVGGGRQTTDGGGDGVWPPAETLGKCGEHVWRRHDSVAPDPFLEIRSSLPQRDKHGPHQHGLRRGLRVRARPTCAQLCATSLRQNVHSPHLASIATQSDTSACALPGAPRRTVSHRAGRMSTRQEWIGVLTIHGGGGMYNHVH